MKSYRNSFVAVLLILGLFSGSLIYAQGFGMSAGGGGRWQQNQRGFGPGVLLRQEMFQVRLNALAELSGASVDEIASKLEYKPMWAILDEYKVDFKVFQAKMHEKVLEMVNEAAKNGKITAEQKDIMLNQMQNGPQQNVMRGGGFGRQRGRFAGGWGFCRGAGFGPAN